MGERRVTRIMPVAGGKRPGVHLRSMPAIESHWMTTFDLRWLQHLREERQPPVLGSRESSRPPVDPIRCVQRAPIGGLGGPGSSLIRASTATAPAA